MGDIANQSCGFLTSAGIGALVAVIGLTLWNRRKQRMKNQNRVRPWGSQAKLYHTPSFRSARCTWLIQELGVSQHFDIQPYNPYLASETERDWYTSKVNPTGKIPALQVDGEVITESAAICVYLAAAYDALLPSQDKEHVYYNWITHAVVVLDPMCRTLYRQLQKTPADQQDGALITSALQTYATFANKLNNHLETDAFLCGKELTAADVVVGYNVMWISTIKGGLLLQDYANVKDYLGRLKARKAFTAGMGSLRDWLNIPQWEATPTEK